MRDERAQVICDECLDGHHDNCVEVTSPYDHQGVDLRVCWCRCADAAYPTNGGERDG